jgi:hypothetical protein
MDRSEWCLGIGFEVYEGIHIGQWVLIVASFKADLVAIPSDMMLFEIDSHHQLIALFQCNPIRNITRTASLLIVQITQSFFGRSCYKSLLFKLLGSSPIRNYKTGPCLGIVLSIRMCQYSLWYDGAEPNEGSAFSRRRICDLNLERKMRLIFRDWLVGNDTRWEYTSYPLFLTGPSQKYISINLIQGVVFCVESQLLEGAWIKMVKLGSPFQVCNNAHVISHLFLQFLHPLVVILQKSYLLLEMLNLAWLHQNEFSFGWPIDMEDHIRQKLFLVAFFLSWLRQEGFQGYFIFIFEKFDMDMSPLFNLFLHI